MSTTTACNRSGRRCHLGAPRALPEDASDEMPCALWRCCGGSAVMSVRGTCPTCLGLGFANELTIARRTVPTRSGAVVHQRVRAQPYNYIRSDTGRSIDV